MNHFENEPFVVTNIGTMPVQDYLELKALQYGFDSYAELVQAGYHIAVPKTLNRPAWVTGRKDSSMKLTTTDKKMLLEWGHPESDFRQIEEAFKKSKTKYELGGKPISREEAICLLGQRQYLSGIARSAFHYTAAREVPMSTTGEIVYFDSSNLFR